MHTHPHHADCEENYDLTPAAHPDTPSHLDRLIAFLHSHFGTVEFLSAEDFNAEIRQAEAKNADSDENKEEEIKPETSSRVRDTTQDVDEDVKPTTNGHDGENANDLADRPETAGPVLRIRLDDRVADVTLEDMCVYSSHPTLKKRVQSVLQVASRTITPLAPIHTKSSWIARGGSKRISVKAEQQ